ncbi:asparagine-rich protein [Reticulomyxa filosa]|uniref:Asparagine-rich protein n=1 Tax=Reticulomyxa filosa TaxID=46433 RepID=X6NQG2_RETFI|nr:asparagine-rich protein [Reticulomyxa filosa]|eukprot:ETO27607.1 asparagine-rich protein [Reticulomyxa filosa]
MPPFEVLVMIGSEQYTLHLTSLTLKHLKEQIIAVSKNDGQENMIVNITDWNGHDIESDQQLQNISPLNFRAHFQEKKDEETKRTKHEYKIKNGLVLIMGAIQSDLRDNLESMRQDLGILQALFELHFGYRAFNNFNARNRDMECLTLSELKNFIWRHLLGLTDNGMDYDGLIIVWCEYHHSNGSNGHTLQISSDHAMNNLKEIEMELIEDSCYFEGKPKILIHMSYKTESEEYNKNQNGNGNGNGNGVWCNQNADVFAMGVTIPLSKKSGASGKESLVISTLCQDIQSNGSKQSVQDIVRRLASSHVFDRGVETYLLPNPTHKIRLDIMAGTLDFKTHWNRDWKKSNAEAVKTVMQMLHENEQGVVVVSYNISAWQKAISKSSIAMDDNVNTNININNNNNNNNNNKIIIMIIIMAPKLFHFICH